MKWVWEIGTATTSVYGIVRLWRAFLGAGPRLTAFDVLILGLAITGIFRGAFKTRVAPFRIIVLVVAVSFSVGLACVAWSYANLWTPLESVACGAILLKPDYCSTIRTRRIASDFRPLRFAFVASPHSGSGPSRDPCQQYIAPSSKSIMFRLDRSGPGPEFAISWRVEPGSEEWRVVRQFVHPFDNGASRAEPGISREASPNVLKGLKFNRGSTRVDVIICGIPDEASEHPPQFDLYFNITDIKVDRLSR